MENFTAMQLREADESEIARVVELEADRDATPFMLRWTEVEHLQAISVPDQDHLALSVDGEFVGFVFLNGLGIPHRSVELPRIVVSRPGRGLGRTGLTLIIRHVVERLGAHRLWLDVKVANVRGRRAYERAGFVREGVLRDVLLTDETYEPLIVMSILESDRPGNRA